MIDDNQKKFIPQLAIDTEFFKSAFPPYGAFGQAIECLMANYCTRGRGIFKGLSQDGRQADFATAALPLIKIYRISHI